MVAIAFGLMMMVNFLRKWSQASPEKEAA